MSRRLAGPHVPVSLTWVEQSVKRARNAYDKAERARHQQQRAERQAPEAAAADTEDGVVVDGLGDDLADAV